MANKFSQQKFDLDPVAQFVQKAVSAIYEPLGNIPIIPANGNPFDAGSMSGESRFFVDPKSPQDRAIFLAPTNQYGEYENPLQSILENREDPSKAGLMFGSPRKYTDDEVSTYRRTVAEAFNIGYDDVTPVHETVHTAFHEYGHALDLSNRPVSEWADYANYSGSVYQDAMVNQGDPQLIAYLNAPAEQAANYNAMHLIQQAVARGIEIPVAHGWTPDNLTAPNPATGVRVGKTFDVVENTALAFGKTQSGPAYPTAPPGWSVVPTAGDYRLRGPQGKTFGRGETKTGIAASWFAQHPRTYGEGSLGVGTRRDVPVGQNVFNSSGIDPSIIASANARPKLRVGMPLGASAEAAWAAAQNPQFGDYINRRQQRHTEASSNYYNQVIAPMIAGRKDVSVVPMTGQNGIMSYQITRGTAEPQRLTVLPGTNGGVGRLYVNDRMVEVPYDEEAIKRGEAPNSLAQQRKAFGRVLRGEIGDLENNYDEKTGVWTDPANMLTMPIGLESRQNYMWHGGQGSNYTFQTKSDSVHSVDLRSLAGAAGVAPTDDGSGFIMGTPGGVKALKRLGNAEMQEQIQFGPFGQVGSEWRESTFGTALDPDLRHTGYALKSLEFLSGGLPRSGSSLLNTDVLGDYTGWSRAQHTIDLPAGMDEAAKQALAERLGGVDLAGGVDINGVQHDLLGNWERGMISRAEVSGNTLTLNMLRSTDALSNKSAGKAFTQMGSVSAVMGGIDALDEAQLVENFSGDWMQHMESFFAARSQTEMADILDAAGYTGPAITQWNEQSAGVLSDAFISTIMPQVLQNKEITLKGIQGAEIDRYLDSQSETIQRFRDEGIIPADMELQNVIRGKTQVGPDQYDVQTNAWFLNYTDDITLPNGKTTSTARLTNFRPEFMGTEGKVSFEDTARAVAQGILPPDHPLAKLAGQGTQYAQELINSAAVNQGDANPSGEWVDLFNQRNEIGPEYEREYNRLRAEAGGEMNEHQDIQARLTALSKATGGKMIAMSEYGENNILTPSAESMKRMSTAKDTGEEATEVTRQYANLAHNTLTGGDIWPKDVQSLKQEILKSASAPGVRTGAISARSESVRPTHHTENSQIPNNAAIMNYSDILRMERARATELGLDPDTANARLAANLKENKPLTTGLWHRDPAPNGAQQGVFLDVYTPSQAKELFGTDVSVPASTIHVGGDVGASGGGDQDADPSRMMSTTYLDEQGQVANIPATPAAKIAEMAERNVAGEVANRIEETIGGKYTGGQAPSLEAVQASARKAITRFSSDELAEASRERASAKAAIGPTYNLGRLFDAAQGVLGWNRETNEQIQNIVAKSYQLPLDMKQLPQEMQNVLRASKTTAWSGAFPTEFDEEGNATAFDRIPGTHNKDASNMTAIPKYVLQNMIAAQNEGESMFTHSEISALALPSSASDELKAQVQGILSGDAEASVKANSIVQAVEDESGGKAYWQTDAPALAFVGIGSEKAEEAGKKFSPYTYRGGMSAQSGFERLAGIGERYQALIDLQNKKPIGNIEGKRSPQGAIKRAVQAAKTLLGGTRTGEMAVGDISVSSVAGKIAGGSEEFPTNTKAPYVPPDIAEMREAQTAFEEMLQTEPDNGPELWEGDPLALNKAAVAVDNARSKAIDNAEAAFAAGQISEDQLADVYSQATGYGGAGGSGGNGGGGRGTGGPGGGGDGDPGGPRRGRRTRGVSAGPDGVFTVIAKPPRTPITMKDSLKANELHTFVTDTLAEMNVPDMSSQDFASVAKSLAMEDPKKFQKLVQASSQLQAMRNKVEFPPDEEGQSFNDPDAMQGIRDLDMSGAAMVVDSMRSKEGMEAARTASRLVRSPKPKDLPEDVHPPASSVNLNWDQISSDARVASRGLSELSDSLKEATVHAGKLTKEQVGWIESTQKSMERLGKVAEQIEGLGPNATTEQLNALGAIRGVLGAESALDMQWGKGTLREQAEFQRHTGEYRQYETTPVLEQMIDAYKSGNKRRIEQVEKSDAFAELPEPEQDRISGMARRNAMLERGMNGYWMVRHAITDFMNPVMEGVGQYGQQQAAVQQGLAGAGFGASTMLGSEAFMSMGSLAGAQLSRQAAGQRAMGETWAPIMRAGGNGAFSQAKSILEPAVGTGLGVANMATQFAPMFGGFASLGGAAGLGLMAMGGVAAAGVVSNMYEYTQDQRRQNRMTLGLLRGDGSAASDPLGMIAAGWQAVLDPKAARRAANDAGMMARWEEGGVGRMRSSDIGTFVTAQWDSVKSDDLKNAGVTEEDFASAAGLVFGMTAKRDDQLRLDYLGRGGDVYLGMETQKGMSNVRKLLAAKQFNRDKILKRSEALTMARTGMSSTGVGDANLGAAFESELDAEANDFRFSEIRGSLAEQFAPYAQQMSANRQNMRYSIDNESREIEQLEKTGRYSEAMERRRRLTENLQFSTQLGALSSQYEAFRGGEGSSAYAAATAGAVGVDKQIATRRLSMQGEMVAQLRAQGMDLSGADKLSAGISTAAGGWYLNDNAMLKSFNSAQQYGIVSAGNIVTGARANMLGIDTSQLTESMIAGADVARGTEGARMNAQGAMNIVRDLMKGQFNVADVQARVRAEALGQQSKVTGRTYGVTSGLYTAEDYYGKSDQQQQFMQSSQQQFAQFGGTWGIADQVMGGQLYGAIRTGINDKNYADVGRLQTYGSQIEQIYGNAAAVGGMSASRLASWQNAAVTYQNDRLGWESYRAAMQGNPVAMANRVMGLGVTRDNAYTLQVQTEATGGTVGQRFGYDVDMTDQRFAGYREAVAGYGALRGGMVGRHAAQAGLDPNRIGSMNQVQLEEAINTTQFDMTMYQHNMQLRQQARNRATVTGVGVAGLSGQWAAAGASSEMIALASASGGQWGIEDRQIALGRAQQDYSYGMQGRQLGLSERRFEVGQQQWQANYDLQMRQTQTGWEKQQREMGIGANIRRTEAGWQLQDIAFQRNMSEMQFGFNMIDADENIRYSTGRQRRVAMRHRDEAVITQSMQMGQMDREEDRTKQRQKWAEEQYQREVQYFQTEKRFQMESMEQQKRNHAQDVEFQKEDLQMSRERYEMERQFQLEGRELEDQNRALSRANTLVEMQEQEELTKKTWEATQALDAFQAQMSNISGFQAQSAAKTAAQATQGGIDALDGSLSQLGNLANTVVNWVSQSIGMGVGGGSAGDISQYSWGGYVPPRNFDNGGFTGVGGKLEPKGIVHGGEYVVPQDGSLVLKSGDESAKWLMKILDKLDLIHRDGGNAMININNNNPVAAAVNLYEKVWAN